MSQQQQPSSPAQILTATHTTTEAVHKDTQQILGLLAETSGDGEEDRIDQILKALSDLLTSTAALHAKVDALGSPRV